MVSLEAVIFLKLSNPQSNQCPCIRKTDIGIGTVKNNADQAAYHFFPQRITSVKPDWSVKPVLPPLQYS